MCRREGQSGLARDDIVTPAKNRIVPAVLRGRPRDPAKRQALLDAARKLFLLHGVDGVTIDEIIAAAGVSRSTFYSNFEHKDALFTAVIKERSQQIATDEWVNTSLSGDFEASVIAFGERLLKFVGEPETFALERLLGHAAQTDPGHAAMFFNAGPGRARNILTLIIVKAQEQGVVRRTDPQQAANDLMGLWHGFWRLEMVYGGQPAPDERERSRLARHGVHQFLKLYGA